MQLFTSKDRTTINWASGTSTELFIHPSDGSFAERNFLFRISTATVAAEESTFTYFEGITRHLMILKGSLGLVHEGRYTKHLQPYDQDVFSGEWPTRSKGKVTDFNLMLKDGATGTLKHESVAQGKDLSVAADAAYYFIYVAAGSLQHESGTIVQASDLVKIEQNTPVKLRAIDASELVIVSVVLIN